VYFTSGSPGRSNTPARAPLRDNDELPDEVQRVYLPLVYDKAKVACQEHCPIGELLGLPPKEGAHLESKSTFRTCADIASCLSHSRQKGHHTEKRPCLLGKNGVGRAGVVILQRTQNESLPAVLGPAAA
jgi:hypothetical protein